MTDFYSSNDHRRIANFKEIGATLRTHDEVQTHRVFDATKVLWDWMTSLDAKNLETTKNVTLGELVSAWAAPRGLRTFTEDKENA